MSLAACGVALLLAACGHTSSRPAPPEDDSGGAASGGRSSTVAGAPPTSGGSGGANVQPPAAAGAPSEAQPEPVPHPAEPCESARPSSTGGGFEICDDGSMRRHEPSTCLSSVPRSEPASGIVYDECARDADCTERAHGYCVIGACYYGCVQDSDCGESQVCFCRDPIGTCESAGCRSDADCPPDYPCTGNQRPPGGSVIFACQTPLDECQADSDCEDPDPRMHCVLVEGTRRCVRDLTG
jgi:hypothetical protein